MSNNLTHDILIRTEIPHVRNPNLTNFSFQKKSKCGNSSVLSEFENGSIIYIDCLNTVNEFLCIDESKVAVMTLSGGQRSLEVIYNLLETLRYNQIVFVSERRWQGYAYASSIRLPPAHYDQWSYLNNGDTRNYQKAFEIRRS